uniref:Uncharacterized protein n=1 Tax=Tetraodon nigroviridis TaxID=99883 RepID=H3DNE7_TETNG
MCEREQAIRKELSEREQAIRKEMCEREQAIRKELSEQVGRVRTLISDQEYKQKKLEVTVMERERLSKLEVVDNMREIRHLSDMVYEMTQANAATKKTKKKNWFLRVLDSLCSFFSSRSRVSAAPST